MATTLEWFGTTTFRLRANGLVIFLDTWLERPDVLPRYLDIEAVTEADYIFISHAHFDHLPGADRIAIKTGAIVIGNGEAINVLRKAGVPEEQLLPVAGGERIPLFTAEQRLQASKDQIKTENGPPAAPKRPHHSLCVAEVHIWPSLHCLMPGHSHSDIPDIMDTGRRYTGTASPYVCTLDISLGMKYGLLRMHEHVSRDQMDDGMRSFVDYIQGPARSCMSNYDGGQLMFNFISSEGVLLWSAHLGGYEGILRSLEPKPDVLIQAIAGRANLNGRPFDGSAAEFAASVSKWLLEPATVIWCLHDNSPIKPWKVITEPATRMVEVETKSRILALEPAKAYSIFTNDKH